jgi:hypothetical protein
MKYSSVKNLTRRPVSILCNSGKSYHLPPKHEHELPGIEIENNAYIEKLKSRNVLAVKDLGEKSGSAGGSEGEQAEDKKPAGEKKSIKKEK